MDDGIAVDAVERFAMARRSTPTPTPGRPIPLMSENSLIEPAGGIVTLDNETAAQAVIESSILGLWSVVNNLTRLRPARDARYRVTIFGSARARPGTVPYEETKCLAHALATMGCDIVTGGGPGLMQAANEGAAEAANGTESVGIRVNLPFEQGANPFVKQAFEHRTFFSRLHHFVLLSDAYIVAPGGIGTALETLMIWQLLQVKHLENTPLILVGSMYRELVDWARTHMLSFDPPLANPADIEIPHCVDTADDAIAIVRKHHAHWLAHQVERTR